MAVLVLLGAGCATPFGTAFHALPRDAVPARIAVASFENRSGFEVREQTAMAEIVSGGGFARGQRLELLPSAP